MGYLHEAVLSDKIKDIKDYQGSDLNEFDDCGMTPLLYSVYSGCDDLVLALLEKGCDPNQADINGVSPLYFAVHEFEFVEIAKLLKRFGAID